MHALLENSKFRSTVRKALPELTYYVILYMQITEEQVDARRAPGGLPGPREAGTACPTRALGTRARRTSPRLTALTPSSG